MFQIFFLVITFSLYNGLVVLPIILSHFGPKMDVIDYLENPIVPSKAKSHEENKEIELNQKMLLDGVNWVS